MSGTQFITGVGPYGEGSPAWMFRREFTVSPGLRKATLAVTALGVVEPYLNGERVGEDVLAPGWTSYRHRLNVTTYDVTNAVTEGANAFGAIVGEGWAVGRIGYEHLRNHYADRPALWAQLTLEYADGTATITTDREFTVGTGPVLANGIYDGETYDARLEQVGWARPGFDDSHWQASGVLQWCADALVEHAAPPIRRFEEIEPVGITTSPSGRVIVDFGQVITGWIRIKVSGGAGQAVTLRHAELLTPDGEPEYDTLRTARATDTYILRGDAEPETWEPRFTFHGFRYVEVVNWPGTLDESSLRAVVVHSQMNRIGWFDSSNPLLNRLHENALWSMRGNFLSVPTDCPQRDERLGWTGDLNAFAPTAAFLYDLRDVLGSWLADLVAEFTAQGQVPWVVPNVLSTPCPPAALWSDVIVHLPWTLYWAYGQVEILASTYEPMVAFTRQVEALLHDGLWDSGHQFGDWLDPDAPKDDAAGGRTDRYLVATAFFYRTASIMAQTAELLGHQEDSRQFAQLAARVRAAFRHEFVTGSGRLVSDSQTAYALALAFELLDGDEVARAGRRLAELVTSCGYRVATGFAGTPWVALALADAGHVDTSYLLVTETQPPSFMYPVTQGATTMWERWDAVLPDGSLNETGMTSLNHYAFGAVATWMHRVVGGLRPIEPGYRRMRIAPQPGPGVDSATVAHETVHGRVEVSWARDGELMTMTITVPDGAAADVVLPLHPDDLQVSVAGGTHTWQYEVAQQPGGRTGPYTMDTAFDVLAADPAAWRALSKVFADHLPFPINAGGPEAAVMTLNGFLEVLPANFVTDELRRDLSEAVRDL